MYRNTVTAMICDKFGAEIDHRRDGNTIVFNSKSLNKNGRIYQTNHIGIKPVLCDAVTHRDHREGPATFSNNQVEIRNSNPSENTHVNHSDHTESPNHTKKKCPYCEYEEDPFFLKVHIKNTHEEQGNDSI